MYTITLLIHSPENGNFVLFSGSGDDYESAEASVEATTASSTAGP